MPARPLRQAIQPWAFQRHCFSTTSHLQRQPIPLPQADYDNASPDSHTSMSPLPSPRGITPRRALLLFDIPVPPTSWPSHLNTMSPLLSKAGTFPSLAVNAAYSGGEGTWPKLREKEVYPAQLMYNNGKIFSWRAFDEDTFTTAEWAAAMAYEPVGVVDGAKSILVCTHGSRDCRCADQGGPLVAALREEVARRGADVQVKEVSHVGGHKWAANAINGQTLDMLSNLREVDAGLVLDFALGVKDRGWEHWRGRFGWSKEKQAEFGVSLGEGGAKLKTDRGDKVSLTFRTFDGVDKHVEARIGDTLLEVAQVNDLPSMEGMCGGNLECATCHCYLVDKPSPPPVPEPSEDELDMLGYAVGYRDGESRLGCQIEVTPELAKWCADGSVIDLPRF